MREIRNLLDSKASNQFRSKPSNHQAKALELESKASYVVLRAEVLEYLNSEGELHENPIKMTAHYTVFPKLVKGSTDYDYFVSGRELREDRKSKLKEKFKDIIKHYAIMASKHVEEISLVIPNAFFTGLNKENKGIAKKIFVQAAVEVAEEMKSENNFHGMFIRGGDDKLNELINNNTLQGIAVNMGDLNAPNLVQKEGKARKFAIPIMGDGRSPVGNGAVSNRGNHAVEEGLTRKTIGGLCGLFDMNLNDALRYKTKNLEKFLMNAVVGAVSLFALAAVISPFFFFTDCNFFYTSTYSSNTFYMPSSDVIIYPSFVDSLYYGK